MSNARASSARRLLELRGRDGRKAAIHQTAAICLIAAERRIGVVALEIDVALLNAHACILQIVITPLLTQRGTAFMTTC
jgi:hypothetical protein